MRTLQRERRVRRQTEWKIRAEESGEHWVEDKREGVRGERERNTGEEGQDNGHVVKSEEDGRQVEDTGAAAVAGVRLIASGGGATH